MHITLMGTGAVSGHSRQEESSSSYCETNANINVQSRSHFSESTTPSRSSEPSSSSVKETSTAKTMKMSCEKCSVNFTVFRRKKFCQECHRFFCSTCLPKPPPNTQIGRQCSKCRLLMSGNFCRGDLQDWKVKDIRCFLNVRNISTKACREKHDLIELVLIHFRTARRNSLEEQVVHDFKVQEMAARMRNVGFEGEDIHFANDESGSHSSTEHQAPSEPAAQPPEGPTDTSQPSNLPDENEGSPSTSAAHSQPNTSEGHSDGGTEEQPQNQAHWQNLMDSMERLQETLNHHVAQSSIEDPKPSQRNRRTHLDDIKTESDIDSLSVRQLKELLINNFVNFKGCCEKAELVDRVHRLYKDHLENKTIAERLHHEEEAELVELHHSHRSTQGPMAPPEPPPPFKPEEEEEEVEEKKEEEEEEATNDILSPPSSSQATEGPTAACSPPSSSNVLPALTSSTSPSARNEARNDSLCHVCMDALTDCILLECGHMVTCTACGKQLADCPICRQYISRVVRVFRS